MFYLLCALSVNTGLSATYGGGTLQVMLHLGCWVIALCA